MRRAIASGFQIGNVAALPNDEIESLIGAESGAVRVRFRPGSETQTGERLEHHLQRCFDHVVNLDGAALESQLEVASVDLSRIDLLDRLLVPLMQRVGQACADGSCRIANEHLASNVTRSFLHSIRAAYPTTDSAPGIVVATPAGQHHELAAMVVAAAARSEGWRTTYLGANTPAEDIASTVRTTRAEAIALSITWPKDDAALAADLEKLGRLLPDDVLLVVGGLSAEAYSETLDRIGARRPLDLVEFRNVLGNVRSSRHAS